MIQKEVTDTTMSTLRPEAGELGRHTARMTSQSTTFFFRLGRLKEADLKYTVWNDVARPGRRPVVERALADVARDGSALAEPPYEPCLN